MPVTVTAGSAHSEAGSRWRRPSGQARMEFGYTPPQRSAAPFAFTEEEYLPSLYRTLDLVCQGFKSVWIGDHLDVGGSYLLECWTHVAWLAARYTGIQIGTHVLANPFRNPALIAKMAASLQALTSGRFVLGYGVGTGRETEYTQFGYTLPRPRVRVEMLEEALQVIKLLWTESPANFSGKYYWVADNRSAPKPNPVPPILVGGAGERRTLRVVAHHADWWNIGMILWQEAPRKLEVLRRYCAEEERDYDSIRKTFAAVVFINKSHAKAVEQAGELRGHGHRR